jgi:hypothetical protein
MISAPSTVGLTRLAFGICHLSNGSSKSESTRQCQRFMLERHAKPLQYEYVTTTHLSEVHSDNLIKFECNVNVVLSALTFQTPWNGWYLKLNQEKYMPLASREYCVIVSLSKESYHEYCRKRKHASGVRRLSWDPTSRVSWKQAALPSLM